MEQAIYLSKISTGGPFGAVIIDNTTNEIVGQGHNEVVPSNDPTAHAEIVAIRKACANLKTHILSNHTLYTSCEPCPMCLSAAYWANVSKIVFANTRFDAANIGFKDEFLYDELKKPWEYRNIPIIHESSAAALQVFHDWFDRENKIMY